MGLTPQIVAESGLYGHSAPPLVGIRTRGHGPETGAAYEAGIVHVGQDASFTKVVNQLISLLAVRSVARQLDDEEIPARASGVLRQNDRRNGGESLHQCLTKGLSLCYKMGQLLQLNQTQGGLKFRQVMIAANGMDLKVEAAPCARKVSCKAARANDSQTFSQCGITGRNHSLRRS